MAVGREGCSLVFLTSKFADVFVEEAEVLFQIRWRSYGLAEPLSLPCMEGSAWTSSAEGGWRYPCKLICRCLRWASRCRGWRDKEISRQIWTPGPSHGNRKSGGKDEKQTIKASWYLIQSSLDGGGSDELAGAAKCGYGRWTRFSCRDRGVLRSAWDLTDSHGYL